MSINTTITASITASIFVVPNPTTILQNLSAFTQRELMTQMESHFPADWKILPSDQLVEIWTHNESSNNWSCHGTDKQLGIANWPSFIPARLLAGLKEGETLPVTIKDFDGHLVTINLVANQLGFRYSQFGTFEQTLDRVTR